MNQFPNKNGYFFLIGLILIIGIFVSDNFFRKRKFLINGKIERANITRIESKPWTGIDISYKYVFFNKIYSNSSNLAKFSKSIYNIVGDKRPILAIVDTIEPTNAYLLMNMNDYEKFKIHPPDSVVWIFAYTE